jgi:hypothetical protein
LRRKQQMQSKATGNELWELHRITIIQDYDQPDDALYCDNIVAVFTSKQLAQDYIDASKLSSGGFSRRSLLKCANYAAIRKQATVPVDPPCPK